MTFDPDWLSRLLGPRLRWKLQRLGDDVSRLEWQIRNRLRLLGVRHKMCPRCRRLVERRTRACPSCGYRFGFLEATPWGRILSAAGGWEFAATPLIVAANVLLYAVGVILSGPEALAPGRGVFGLLGPTEDVQIRMGEVSLAFLRYHGEYWRLITANFLHAGLIHLFFNMSVLSYLAPPVERMLGREKFVCVYFVSGAGGLGISLFSIGLFTPTIGASAAVFGLIASILVCAAFRRDPASVAIRNQMVRIIILVLVFGFVVQGINNMGHIAGGILGAGVTLLGGPSWPRRGWQRNLWGCAESAAIGLTIAAFVVMVFHGA